LAPASRDLVELAGISLGGWCGCAIYSMAESTNWREQSVQVRGAEASMGGFLIAHRNVCR